MVKANVIIKLPISDSEKVMGLCDRIKDSEIVILPRDVKVLIKDSNGLWSEAFQDYEVEEVFEEDPLHNVAEEEIKEYISGEEAIEAKMEELAKKAEDGGEEEILVKRRRPKILSDNADEFLKEHYKENIDRELAETIKKVFGEQYTNDQIKEARKRLGLKKEKNRKNEKRDGKPRTKWTEEHFEWLRENIEDYGNAELHKKLVEKFDLDVTLNAMQARMCIVGITRKNRTAMPKTKNPARPFNPKLLKSEATKIGKRKGMSKGAIELIEENYMEKTDDELRELIADKTGNFHTSDKIQNYRESNGMARPKGWNPDEFVSEEGD